MFSLTPFINKMFDKKMQYLDNDIKDWQEKAIFIFLLNLEHIACRESLSLKIKSGIIM